MENIIRELIVVSTNKAFEVNGLNGIGSIEDKGIEYPDATHFIYHVKDREGNLIAAVENCPVVIEYFG
jgi:hypothetical protein